MKLKAILAFSAMTAVAWSQTHPANHLVISELGVYAVSGYSNVPTSAEFTEIYNPTDTAVDLSNYYLSDHPLHYDLPSFFAGNRDNTLSNGSDFLLKFPDGASIPPGGVVVVASSGDSFIEAYFNSVADDFYNQPGNPQLFEIWDSSPDIPNMGANYNRTSVDYPLPDPEPLTPADNAANMSHTDAGENCVLFYWDGNSSLAKDVDIVQWLQVDQTWGASANQYTDKSGRNAMGPSGIQETYEIDFGTPDGLTVWYPDWPAAEPQAGQLIRHSLLEVGETNGISGNGILGDDETMELNSLTWEMRRGAPSNASPGIVDLPRTTGSHPPVIGIPRRNIQFPAVGSTVNVSVPIYDDGTFTAQLMVDKGSGFSPVNMTLDSGDTYSADISLAGVAAGARVRWYVTATDNDGNTTTEADRVVYEPTYQPVLRRFPGYHTFMVGNAPFSGTDFIVSELMYDPHGGNNYHHSQYIELYNTTDNPLDLGGFFVTTDFSDGDIDEPSIYQIPHGTVIPPKDFLVLAGAKAVFLRNYPGIDADRVVDIPIRPSNSFIAHPGSNIRFFDPNHFDYDSAPVDNSGAMKLFTYSNNSPWPIGTPQNTGAGNTGFPIELTELTAAAETDPSKWAQGLVYNGTPLAPNSVMRSGDVTVTNVSRSIVYPTSGQDISITADVASSVNITGVNAMVDTGSGFQAFPLTNTGGATWSGSIGSYGDNTLVKYYVEATDADSNTGAFPYNGPMNIVPFRITAGPPTNLVLNEIMYDPSGGDNAGYPEFLEFYNRGSEPIDMSFFQVSYNSTILDNAAVRLLAEGTVIPPGGYLVLAARKDLLEDNYLGPDRTFYRMRYGAPNPDYIVDLGWSDGSKLANGGGTIHIVHPNETVIYSGTANIAGTPYFSLTYSLDAGSGWPRKTDGSAWNGPSFELNEPTLDPLDPSNWSISLSFNGTPGKRNSVTPPPASVSDWSVY